MRFTRRVAIGAATAAMALALPLLAIPASASSGPPWEPDPNTHDTGTLTFYDSSGKVVTGGSNLAHLFDYVQASTADPFKGTKATLEFAQPQPGTATGNFAVGEASPATIFPNASAPAPLNTSANPVVTLGSMDGDLTNFIATQIAPTQAGYVNVYQIRLITSGPGGAGTVGGDQDYWDADVQVDPTAGTWTEVYPVQGATAISTATTLAVSPPGSARQGAAVGLSATVTASDTTHPAGSVEFFQDGISVGTADTDTTTGMATLTTSALLPSAPNGTSLTATFTPTDSSTYSQSNSATVQYTVNPVAVVPTISGAHQVGAKETCSEGRLDFGVTASFTWLASGKTVGTGSSLVVPGSADKKSLSCRASVHDGTGPSSTATSKSVTVSPGKAPRATKRPTLSGRHKVGTKETVKHGTWSPSSVTFTYQWLLNGKVIKGATKVTLTLGRADRGRLISCRVTAHKSGFTNGTATTAGVRVSG